MASIIWLRLGDSLVGDQEHAAPPDPCSGLSTAEPLSSSTNAVIAVGVAGDHRAGADLFGEVLEVGLVDGVGQAGRVVDDQAPRRIASWPNRTPEVTAQGRSVASSAGSLRIISTSSSST